MLGWAHDPWDVEDESWPSAARSDAVDEDTSESSDHMFVALVETLANLDCIHGGSEASGWRGRPRRSCSVSQPLLRDCARILTRSLGKRFLYSSTPCVKWIAFSSFCGSAEQGRQGRCSRASQGRRKKSARVRAPKASDDVFAMTFFLSLGHARSTRRSRWWQAVLCASRCAQTGRF